MLDLRDPENINGSERHWIPRFDFIPKKTDLNKIFVYCLICCWNGQIYEKLFEKIGGITNVHVSRIIKRLKEEGKVKILKQGYNSHGICQPNIYETNEPNKCNFNFDLFGELKDSKAIGLYFWMRGHKVNDKADSKFGNYFYSMPYSQYTYFKDLIQKLGTESGVGLIEAHWDDDGQVKILFVKEKRYPHLEDEE